MTKQQQRAKIERGRCENGRASGQISLLDIVKPYRMLHIHQGCLLHWRNATLRSPCNCKHTTRHCAITFVYTAAGYVCIFTKLVPFSSWETIPYPPAFLVFRFNHTAVLCFPYGTSGKEPIYQCRRYKRCGFDPRFGKTPWRRAWKPNPVLLPGEYHGQRSLEGYSPQGHRELDMTEAT